MVTAALCHWLKNNQSGHEYMAHLQQLDSVSGRNERVYKLRDGFGRLTKEINPERIFFLRGCIVEGEAVPLSMIEVMDKETDSCESCGSKTVCTTNIRIPHNDTLETLCSNCISSGENLSLRDQVKVKCEDCTYMECNWHPINNDVPAYNSVI